MEEDNKKSIDANINSSASHEMTSHLTQTQLNRDENKMNETDCSSIKSLSSSLNVDDNNSDDDADDDSFHDCESFDENIMECNANNNKNNNINDEKNSENEGLEQNNEWNHEQNNELTDEQNVTDDEYSMELEKSLSDDELQLRKSESVNIKNEGNQKFKEKEFKKSVEFYTKALRLCPTKFTEERSVMYANRAAAYIHLDMKQKAISDCGKAIDLSPNYLKAILRRAQLLRESQDKLDDALTDYKRVLELDPCCSEAREAVHQLPNQINERNERMKEEMISKLKDLGNLVLRPFGLSTDNFKLTQNPETGGYSVNFQNK